MIPVIDDRLDQERRRLLARGQGIANIGGVRSRLHPDAQLDKGLAAGESPGRDGPFEPELLDKLVPGRGHGPASPPVGAQVVGFTSISQRGIGLDQHDRAAHRRVGRRDQQTVITTRDHAGHGPRGIASLAIGGQPLAQLRDLETAADLAAEFDNGFREWRELHAVPSALWSWFR